MQDDIIIHFFFFFFTFSLIKMIIFVDHKQIHTVTGPHPYLGMVRIHNEWKIS